jgi:hypothetical protein
MNVVDAQFDVLFFDKRQALENEVCELRMDDTQIVLSYEDEDGYVIYKGKNNGDGHFELSCPERNGKATLHVFRGCSKLDGYWQEDGYHGMWRVHARKKINY